MKKYLRLMLRKIVSALCERWDLVLENVALRHQIDVLEHSGRRPQFSNVDRMVWVTLSAVWPRWPEALEIVHADTVKRWRRQGFRHYLLGKSRRRRPGRPAVDLEIRSLIRYMSRQKGLFRNLLNLPAPSAGLIVDESVSFQAIHQIRNQTVIAPVGFTGRGPPNC